MRLFDEFERAGAAEWREAASQSLKGRSAEEMLASGTLEGIRRRPIYHEEDRPAVEGSLAAMRGEDWQISQELDLEDPAEFNGALRDLLERGQGVVNTVLAGSGRAGLAVGKLDDLHRAFDGVWADAVHYRFLGARGLETLALFAAWLKLKEADGGKIHGCLGLDPLGDLARLGSADRSLTRTMDEVAACAAHNLGCLPHFRAGLVSSMPLHDAGASADLELGASLANGVWMVRELCRRGLTVGEAVSQLAFTQAVGSDFFMEIAKLRAARLLWHRVAEELGAGDEASVVPLHARTGCYTKTRLQPETNLVRTTWEALAAVIGGADSVSVGRFDEIIGQGSAFSGRIAVNLLLILREECGMTVSDPAGGSYYVESLTEQLGEAAWSRFQEIESEGGAFEVLRSGFLADRVRATHRQRKESLARRKTTLVGVNSYCQAEDPDAVVEEDSGTVAAGSRSDAGAETESPQAAGELAGVIVEAVQEALAGRGVEEIRRMHGECFSGGGGGTVEPLPTRRLARPFEKLAAQAAAGGKSGSGVGTMGLIRLGSPGKCRLRLEFVRDFFGVAGFRFEETVPAEDGAVAVPGSIAVVCADPGIGGEAIIDTIRAAKADGACRYLLVAMKPDDGEAAMREAGADGFIYRGCDHYAMNREVLQVLGVMS